MKKLTAGVLFAVVLISASSAAFAHGNGCCGQLNGGCCAYHPNTACRYVDENGDGICDNFGIANSGGVRGCGMGRQRRGYCGR